VKPTVEAYTVAIPWYEPEDFDQLWAMTSDGGDAPPDYDTWHRSAVAVVSAWLATGRALQIVTIRPAGLIAWLDIRGLANTTENQRRYAEHFATRNQDAA
jgi:hypothetical protein